MPVRVEVELLFVECAHAARAIYLEETGQCVISDCIYFSFL